MITMGIAGGGTDSAALSSAVLRALILVKKMNILNKKSHSLLSKNLKF